MSARLARTAEGWWLVTPVGPIRLGLTAPTMARLLPDRAALDAAIQAGRKAAAAPRQAVPAGSLDLLSPVAAPVLSVAQMVNYPTGSTLAEPSVWSSRAASCGACELARRTGSPRKPHGNQGGRRDRHRRCGCSHRQRRLPCHRPPRTGAADHTRSAPLSHPTTHSPRPSPSPDCLNARKSSHGPAVVLACLAGRPRQFTQGYQTMSGHPSH